jgi:LysM repeat protein
MDPEVTGSTAAATDDVVPDSETARPNSSARRGEAAGELLKFGAVVAVLLVTVLVIALLRPLIFGQIVPAVMGTGLEGEPAANPDPAPIQIPMIVVPDPPAPLESEEPARVEEQPAAGVADDAPAVDEPAVEPVPLTHAVQPNETLTAIARQYGVTVEALVTTNGIRNPNRIEAGTTLLIPTAPSDN